jgi:hypothetical protein
MFSDWEPSDWIALLAGITALMTVLLSKHIVAAAVKWGEYRQKRLDRRRADQAIEDELNERGYKFIIKRQDRQITELEKEVEEIRREHETCRSEFAALNVQYTQLATRLAFFEGRK